MENLEVTEATPRISYCGYKMPVSSYEETLSNFKQKFVKDFSLENQIKESEIENEGEISIYYIDEKSNKKTEIKNESDYKQMLDNLSTFHKKTIYVETKVIPVHFDGEQSIEFEDEIKKVVERELRIAANNIKKCLTTNISLGNCKKIRTQTCENCKNQIIGYLYKTIDCDEKDKYYCELCSASIQTPMFKIN